MRNARLLCLLLAVLFIVSTGGVYATWSYAENDVDKATDKVPITVGPIQSPIPANSFYISDARTTVANGSTVKELYYEYTTYLISTITLSASTSSSATFEVVVSNETGEDYEYNAAKYGASDYSNANIKFTATNTKTGKELSYGDSVPAGETLTITVEFTYADGYTPSRAEELSSRIYFEFLPLSSLPDVYISSVEMLTAVGTYSSESIGTNLLDATVSADELTIYKVTMGNRSYSDYGYNGTAVDPTLVDNSLISYSLYADAEYTVKLARRALLPAATADGHGHVTFYLLATGNVNATAGTELDAIFDIRFATPIEDIAPPDSDDTGEIAVENALDKFKEILNTSSELQELETLLDTIPTSGSGWFQTQLRNNTYVAYVPDAPNSDKESALALFDGKLEISIDGKMQTVYFLIKREDVTGDGKEDFTVYMTTNPLTESSTVSGSGGNWFNSYYTKYSPVLATVYAAVFTVDNNDEWIQLGDMYKGTAPVCDYDGGMQNYRPSGSNTTTSVPTGAGSFNTDFWVTATEYYGLAAGATLSDTISAPANDLAALASLIESARNITENADYTILYTAQTRAVLNATLEKAVAAYNACTDQNTTNDIPQAEVVTHKNELDKALSQLKIAQ